MHKAGFVNIIGLPNAGKSTLLNALLGEKLVIATPKAQTTRKRVLGIFNDDESQIVFSDTPGFIHDPHYELHKNLNTMVIEAFTDADMMIYITEPEKRDLGELGNKLRQLDCPLLILINKADMSNVEKLGRYASFLEKEFPGAHVKIISALHGFNVEQIVPFVKTFLSEHPPYFDKEELSDRDIRFFVTERYTLTLQ